MKGLQTILCVIGLIVMTRADVLSESSQKTVSIKNMVDLTHTLTPEFPYIPVPGVTFPFRSIPIATIEKMGVAANRWEIHEHIGTQIDAPTHFIPNGMSLDQMPVRDFIVPLAIIDISKRAQQNADTEVTVDDIKSWEKQFGRLPERAAVFMYSSWSKKINDSDAFINTDQANIMHFPGFSTEAATFLIRKRQISGIGVDVLSIDPGKDKEYKTHKIWLGAGKWAVECVANLDLVPPSGATVFVGATKVGGATGGPVRLIATFDSSQKSQLSVQQLAGKWKSMEPENIGSGNYMTREFTFTVNWWQVKAEFYGDQQLQTPLIVFVGEGPYKLGESSSVVPGATNAVFSFSKKNLTLLSPDRDVVSRFNLDKCNLTIGVAKDISETGCSSFTSIAECAQEYDLVKIEDSTLKLGARPADRNMCTEDKRPKALGLPVTKLSQNSARQ